MNTISMRSRRPAIFATATLVVASALTGCADDDSEDTIPVSDWVTEFNQRCVEIGEELSNPELTDAQYREINERGIAEMRALGTPDNNANEAETLLTVIETSTIDTTLDDEAISALDQQFLDAATVLGISDECIGGAQG
jgi:hypothetical protein